MSGQHAIVNIASELLLSSLERYVTIPKEDFTDRNARRQRAAMGVGLSQMEMVVEEESPAQKGGEDEEMSNPFRFDKCISTRPTTSTPSDQTRKGGKKSKNKNAPIGQSFLAEALNRINEPLPFLIASCMSIAPLMSSEDESEDNDNENNEMTKAIQRLRIQMAQCSDIDEYLKWTKSNKNIFDIKDNIKRAEEMAIAKLATLILVVVVIDVLMNTVEWNNSNGSGLVVMDGSGTTGSVANEVEDLFTLRTDAIDKAAVIMSSFVSSKPKKKKAETSKDKKKKGKKLKEATNSSQELSGGPAEKKKKSGKASSTDKEEGNSITKVKSSDINDTTRLKNRKLFEYAVNNMSPAMSSNFLIESLRHWGAEAMKKASVRSNIFW